MMFTGVKFVDLTHDIDENSPVWPGNTKFSKKLVLDYPNHGFRVMDYNFSAGMGTHIDAPAHANENGRYIQELKLEELIAPACVVDVREKVNKRSDYQVTEEDLKQWEKNNTPIPQGSIVIALTGWSQYWSNEEKYFGLDDNAEMRFPGFSIEAALFLESRGVAGVGIDTLSIDAGTNKEFLTHKTLLGNNLFLIENLTNLDQLPPFGAIIVALPIKIKEGVESPARVIAFKAR